MKKIAYLLTMVGCLAIAGLHAQTKIKDGSVTGTSPLPNANAILELESNSKGIIFPKVALTETDQPAPLSAFVNGVFVYDTVSVASPDGILPAITPGLYYSDGTQWVAVTTASTIPEAWLLLGNTGTVPPANGGTSYIGTNDNQDIEFQIGVNNSDIYSGPAAYIGGANNFGGNLSYGNTAFGANALYQFLTGGATGPQSQQDAAGDANDANLAIGTEAMGNATGGFANEVFGHHALYSNVSGDRNLAMGWASLESNTSGGENVGLGLNSLDKNTSGRRNIAIGHSALYQNQTGTDNIGIGVTNYVGSASQGALYANTTGSGNIAIGSQSGWTSQTGSYNLFLGYAADAYSSTGGYTSFSNATAIGYNAHVAAANSMVLGDTTSGGQAVNVGLGVRYPAKRFHVDAANISTRAKDSLRIDNLASSSTSSNNKGVLVIDTTTGYVSGQSIATLAGGSFWSVKGNSGTNSGTNFLGTTDNHALKFKVNNLQAGFIDSTGGGYNTYLGLTSVTAPKGSHNTVVGANSLLANTATGSGNIILGDSSMLKSTTGNYNIVIGDSSLANNTSPSYQIAIGQRTLQKETGGSNEIAIGTYAMQNAATINVGNNIAIGYQSLQNTIGGYNMAIGTYALQTTAANVSNMAVGHLALRYNTTGSGNTAIGQAALGANTTASNNTALGYQAGAGNTAGYGNTLAGTSAGYSNTTGNYSVAIGDSAAFSNTTGANNITMGYKTLYGNTGGDNVAIGHAAGYNTSSTLSKVTLLGDSTNTTGTNAATLANAGAIGAKALIGVSNGISIGDTTANSAAGTYVGIGTAYPTNTLHVKTTVATADPLRVQGIRTFSYTTVPSNATQYKQLLVDTTTGLIKSGIFGAQPIAGVTFYDDTTGLQPTMTGTAPNGTAYSSGSYGRTPQGFPVGGYFTTINPINVDSVKKVGCGEYKVFFHPGALPNANYQIAITSTDGLEVAGDDDWQVCNVPYMIQSGSYLYNACQRENDPLVASRNVGTATTVSGGKLGTGTVAAHYITKTANYCYITSSYGGVYDAAYVSLVVFY